MRHWKQADLVFDAIIWSIYSGIMQKDNLKHG